MRDDTKHLLSSPKNADRLQRAIDKLNAFYGAISEEPIPDDMKEMLARLK